MRRRPTPACPQGAARLAGRAGLAAERGWRPAPAPGQGADSFGGADDSWRSGSPDTRGPRGEARHGLAGGRVQRAPAWPGSGRLGSGVGTPATKGGRRQQRDRSPSAVPSRLGVRVAGMPWLDRLGAQPNGGVRAVARPDRNRLREERLESPLSLPTTREPLPPRSSCRSLAREGR